MADNLRFMTGSGEVLTADDAKMAAQFRDLGLKEAGPPDMHHEELKQQYSSWMFAPAAAALGVANTVLPGATGAVMSGVDAISHTQGKMMADYVEGVSAAHPIAKGLGQIAGAVTPGGLATSGTGKVGAALTGGVSGAGMAFDDLALQHVRSPEGGEKVLATMGVGFLLGGALGVGAHVAGDWASKAGTFVAKGGIGKTGANMILTAEESLQGGEKTPFQEWLGKSGKTLEKGGKYGMVGGAMAANPAGFGAGAATYAGGKAIQSFAHSEVIPNTGALAGKVLMDFDENVLQVLLGNAPAKMGKGSRGAVGFAPGAAEAVSDAQKQAVGDYAVTHYKPVNDFLRTGKNTSKFSDAEIQGTIGHLDAAISGRTLPEDTTLYRGVVGHPEIAAAQPGDIITEPGFMSTAKRQRSAREYTYRYTVDGYDHPEFSSVHPDANMLVIRAKAGQPGMDINKDVHGMVGGQGFETDNEVLLPRNTQLRVTEVVPAAGGKARHVIVEPYVPEPAKPLGLDKYTIMAGGLSWTATNPTDAVPKMAQSMEDRGVPGDIIDSSIPQHIKAAQYLNSVLPKSPWIGTTVAPIPWCPTLTQKAQFMDKVNTVNNPLWALENPTPGRMEALRAVYPVLGQQTALLASQIAAGNPNLSVKERKRLGLIAGIPGTTLSDPKAQAMISQMTAQSEQPQAQQGRPSGGGSNLAQSSQTRLGRMSAK